MRDIKYANDFALLTETNRQEAVIHFFNNIHISENPSDEPVLESVEKFSVIMTLNSLKRLQSNIDDLIKQTEEVEEVKSRSDQIAENGEFNIGDYNSGGYNRGNRNIGDYNRGNRNSGDCNIGGYNSGDYNSGGCNSGDYNIGDCNTGGYNRGNRNIGDYNSASEVAGCFNTESHKIRFFDKKTDITLEQWRNSPAYDLFRSLPLHPTEWVYSENMTEEEKEQHSEHEITGGYLRERDISKSYIEWWNTLSEDEKNTIRAIPNYNAEKFYEITGIKDEANL